METPEPARVSLRDFLNVIFKRKFQILLFFLVTFSTVAFATLLARPTYQAVAQVLVKIGRENIYVPETGSSNPVVSINREEQINSEIEILKSPSLVKEVVESVGPTVIYPQLAAQKPGILASMLSAAKDQEAALPVEKAMLTLQKQLDVQGIKKSNIIEVSFKHHDPQMAAFVVNTLARRYLNRHVEVYKTPHSYEFFQQQSELLKKKLTAAEDRLKELKERYNITMLADQQKILFQRAQDIRMALNQSRSEKAEVENRIQLLGRQLAELPKTIAQGEEIDNNPYIINTLEARLVELQLKEKDLLAKYTEDSRLVKNVREEIGVVKMKLAAQEGKRYGKTRSGVNPTYQNLHEELLRNQADLKALTAKIESQQQQLEAYRKELGDLNKIEVTHDQLQQEVEVDRQNYRLYLTKFEESRISDAMDSEKITSVSLVEPAQVPLKPVSPKVLLNLVLGVFLGALGGLGLAFFLHYLDDGLENVEDVEDALDVPVLFCIPEEQKS
jgi:uncharacterized protein involved in exopolysaccharide biosynthesis